jgi:hypothetical protein
LLKVKTRSLVVEREVLVKGYTHTKRNGVCKEVPTAEGSTLIQELTLKDSLKVK